MSENYNGWTNHATWCVNLWLSNDQGSDGYWREAAQECVDATEADKTFTHEENAKIRLADRLKSELEDQAQEFLSDNASTLWGDLLTSYLSDVDWHELAEAWMEDVEYPEAVEDEE